MSGKKKNEIYGQDTSTAENTPVEKKVIGENEVRNARTILEEYRSYKADYDAQVKENEEWWRLNHWRYLRKKKRENNDIEPTSAWTFNSIVNKHADMMDNIPVPIVLPREQSDDKAARTLTSVLPVIGERCNFEKVYSDNSYSKIKNGLAAYSVVWKDDEGLGDVSIEKVDILNLFWEPGVCDLQASANVFLVNMVKNDVLTATYPELTDKLGSADFQLEKYSSQEKEDDASKSAVIDWYYKKNGMLHFCKFVGETVLFASENEEGYENGFYEHGKYPFVLDAMYPLEGTLFAFGIVAVCRDPQMYIDRLDKIVLENLRFMAKPRWMFSKACGVNTDDFENPDKTVVWVEGDIDDNRGRQITVNDISAVVSNWKTQKIDELKETSSNRDVSQGSTGAGVTSGAAIATLQEAGNKTSRDIIAGSYRAFSEIVKFEIELIREFYTEDRVFRIVGEDGVNEEFITFSNKDMKPSGISDKEPVFDLKIKAQKKSPFSQTATNETAMNLYNAGFFAPQNAQSASVALEMMDFEGIDAVRRRVAEGATLYNQLQQMRQQLAQLALSVQMLTGGAGIAGDALSPHPSPAATPSPSREGVSAGESSGGVSQARSRAEELAANGYSRALVEKAKPDVEK